MNPLEFIKNSFVLLFWYIGERNWTVQSTSTIVKPRKEADEYQPGDKVMARFQGKIYKAVIVRIEGDKEALANDKIRFDQFLRDASLSPKQILEQMGICAELDDENNDDSTCTTKSIKRPALQQKPKKSKIMKTTTPKPTPNTIDSIKLLAKQKKTASLESSKLMAARLLQGTKTDNELHSSSFQSQMSPHSHNSAPAQNSTSHPEQATGLPANSNNQHHQASSPQQTPGTSSKPANSNNQHHQASSSQQTPGTSSKPANSNNQHHQASSSQQTPGTSSKPANSNNQHHQASSSQQTPGTSSKPANSNNQHHQASSSQQTPGTSSKPANSNNQHHQASSSQQTPGTSSKPANSNNQHHQASSSQQTPGTIHTPFQQQNIPDYHSYQQQLLSSMHSQSQMSLPIYNTYQQSQSSNIYTDDWDFSNSGSASEFLAHNLTNEEGRTLDCSKCMPLIQTLTQRINLLEAKVESLITANAHTAPSTPFRSPSSAPAPLITAQSTPQHLQQATPNQSLSSMADQTSEVKKTAPVNENESMSTIELLPGYGIMITVPQLDACLRKSVSGTALARMLVNVFFDDRTLAGSSVRGTKTKPALDKKVTSAIINYVCAKRSSTEREIVQAINQKCADARSSFIVSCKKKL